MRQRRGNQCILRAEMVVERHAGNAGLRHNRFNPGRRNAVPAKQPDGGLDKLQARGRSGFPRRWMAASRSGSSGRGKFQRLRIT